MSPGVIDAAPINVQVKITWLMNQVKIFDISLHMYSSKLSKYSALGE